MSSILQSKIKGILRQLLIIVHELNGLPLLNVKTYFIVDYASSQYIASHQFLNYFKLNFFVTILSHQLTIQPVLSSINALHFSFLLTLFFFGTN